MTVSSIFRTLLYVQIYSLTHLRVAALIWMGLVALGLFWMILRTWRNYSDLWLINANSLSLLVVLYVCSFMDFDGGIAWYNVQNNQEVNQEAQTLDVAYFETQLGTASIPALHWYVNNAHPQPARRQEVAALIDRLQHELTLKQTDWHAWTWQAQRLQDSI